MSAIPEKFHITKHMPSARATEYFSRLVPVNLTTANMSSSIHFKIPSLPNSYILCDSSYFKFKLTNNSATTGTGCDFQLGSGGAMASVVDRISLTNAGATISNYQNYGTYRTVKTSTNATKEYLTGVGGVLQGTNPANAADVGKKGETIPHAAGADATNPQNERVFTDCLANHASLFSCGKAICLDLIEPLDLQYVLGSYSTGGAWLSDNAGVLNALHDGSLIISECELILNVVQLDQNVSRDLMSSHGEKGLCYECTGVNTINSSIAAGVGASSTVLGLGFSSLLALHYVMLPQFKGADGALVAVDPRVDHNNSTFTRNFVERAQFILDGTPISTLRGQPGSAAEMLAASLIYKNKLNAYSGLPHIDETALATVENDKETGANLSGSSGAIFSQDLSIYKGSTIKHEGRGTLSSSSNLDLTYKTPASVRACQLRVFAEFRQLVVLDPVSRTYRVAQ